MKKTAVLKNLLERGSSLVAPGAYDALSARLISYRGFEAVYVTGFGVSAGLLGKPDLGIVSMGEMVAHLERINNSVDLPIIADADSGFGNALNVMRVVELYEGVGIAGLHIEDQCVPKKYQPDGFPQVVPMDEHCDKIRAAAAARKDPDFCIIARTDSLQRYGIHEAVKRGNAYKEAGADMVFVHGASERKDLELIVKEIDIPNVVNYSTLREGGVFPLPTMAELTELGFKLVIVAGELLFCAARAMDLMLEELSARDGLENADCDFMKFDRFSKVLDIAKYTDIENKYLPVKD